MMRLIIINVTLMMAIAVELLLLQSTHKIVSSACVLVWNSNMYMNKAWPYLFDCGSPRGRFVGDSGI